MKGSVVVVVVVVVVAVVVAVVVVFFFVDWLDRCLGWVRLGWISLV